MVKHNSMMAETIRIKGDKGETIDAYLARPLGPGPYGSVVLLHHMPGWDDASKEMARKLAYYGFVCISPDLHYRERVQVGMDAPHEKVSETVRNAGGVPDDRCVGDVQGAMDFLRSQTYTNGKIGVIGFCSGGRQSFLMGCRIPTFSAVVNCWGGGVVVNDPARDITSNMPKAPIEYAANLNAPLLGLFGEEDTRPSPADAAKLDAELNRLGKPHEFHMYKNAGHGFFAVDRPSYRQHAAVDGWNKVIEFYTRHLSGPATGANGQGAAAAQPAGAAR